MNNRIWIIPILVFIALLSACNTQTTFPEGSLPEPEEPQATLPPAPAATVPPESEAQSISAQEAESAEEQHETGQSVSGWRAVSEKANWVLIGYGDALNPIIVQPDTYITIDFSHIDDQVSGSAGCNNYFASYSADDHGGVAINAPVGATQMACETGMEQEGLFLSALETVTGYTVTQDGNLLLDYDSNAAYAEQLVFIPESPLVDTTWVLTAYGNPSNPTLSKPGVVSTAIFSANGTLNGFTGCNDYFTSYARQNDQITVNLSSVSLSACAAGMEQERAFMALLGTVQNYRIMADGLEITTSDGSILRFSAQQIPLENVRWQLLAVGGQAVPQGISANVLFTPAGSPAAQGSENTIQGYAGCNTFSGAYTLTGDTFTAGPFERTQTTCDEATMQIEHALLAGLETAQSFQITGNQLAVNTATGAFLFYADRFPLEGPQWILTGRGPIDNPQPPIEGGIFTANFARSLGFPSGIKSGATGCRNYNATYYADHGRIKVNLPQTSQGTCTDAQLEAEQGYFLSLNAARDYRILGNELYIYDQDQVLIFFGNYQVPPPASLLPLVPLDGTQWRLAGIDSALTLPDTEITISFEIDSEGRTGSISGSSGCNTYDAKIKDAFSLEPVIVSTASCGTPEGIMVQEGTYLTALQTAKSITIAGNTLRIKTEQGTLNFTTRGVETPEPTPDPEVLAAVIIAPSNAHIGQLITYDGSSSTPEGGIISYNWWFSDGSTAEGASNESIYSKAGAYDAVLTVTGADGQKAEASVKTKIHTHLVSPLWVSEGNSTITLSFNGSTLSGFAGCNDYSASYASTTDPGKDNSITIGAISTSGKTCDEGTMEKEQAYLADLTKVTSFRIEFTDLALSTPDLLLGFNATP